MSPRSFTCALTFDDGPDPRWTPRVLECLRREHAPASFFVIAPRAIRHAHLIEQMVIDGHRVQLHCDRHVRHTDMSESAIGRDVARALSRLVELGIAPDCWRTPWGVCTPATHRVASQHDLRIVGWDADTHDWRGDAAVDMHARIADSLRGGSLVLMHDGIGPGARRRGCQNTLDLIPRLLETLRGRGLRAGHVDDRAPLAVSA